MATTTTATTTTATTTIPTATEAASLLPLFAWLSPAFPVGAYAYSHGLEAAVEGGDIHDAATCAAWIADLVEGGAIRADCALLAAAWAAAESATDHLFATNELALALAPSAERRLETAGQGTAFLLAIAAAWPAPAIARFAAAVGGGASGDGEAAYPVAVGVAARAHGLPLRATLGAFALAAAGNLVSAVLRLGPIGQSEAQAITARLCPALDALADWAAGATLDDLGTATWRADVASMRHETQYSRLFRS